MHRNAADAPGPLRGRHSLCCDPLFALPWRPRPLAPKPAPRSWRRAHPAWRLHGIRHLVDAPAAPPVHVRLPHLATSSAQPGRAVHPHECTTWTRRSPRPAACARLPALAARALGPNGSPAGSGGLRCGCARCLFTACICTTRCLQVTPVTCTGLSGKADGASQRQNCAAACWGTLAVVQVRKVLIGPFEGLRWPPAGERT